MNEFMCKRDFAFRESGTARIHPLKQQIRPRHADGLQHGLYFDSCVVALLFCFFWPKLEGDCFGMLAVSNQWAVIVSGSARLGISSTPQVHWLCSARNHRLKQQIRPRHAAEMQRGV